MTRTTLRPSTLILTALTASFLGLAPTAAHAEPIQMRVKSVLCVAPSGPFPDKTMEYVGAAIHGDPKGRVPGPINGMQAPMEYGVPIIAMMGPKGQAAAVGLTGGMELIKQGYEFGKFFDENRVPDDLYIKVNGQKVWPINRDSSKIKAGQTIGVNAVAPPPIGGRHRIELWEHDSGMFEGDDDLLGDLNFGAGAGMERTLTFTLSNKEEGSVYLVEVEFFRPPPPPVQVTAQGGTATGNARTQMCSYNDNLSNSTAVKGLRANDLVADLPPVDLTSKTGAFGDLTMADLTPHEAKSWKARIDTLSASSASNVRKSGIAWTWDVQPKGITFGRQNVVVPYAQQKNRDTNGNFRTIRWISAAPQSASSEYLTLPLEGEFKGDPNPISMVRLKPWLDCLSPAKLRQVQPVLRRMRTQGYLVDTEDDVAKVTRGLTLSERIQLGRSVDNIRAAITEGGFQPTTGNLNSAVGAGSDDRAVVAMLLEMGARPDSNSLMRAVEVGDGELMSSFISKGAKVQANHVHKAISMGDPALVEMVIKKGGKAIVGLSWTDLKNALDAGDNKLAGLLVGAGAPSNATVLRLALRSRDAALISRVAHATPPDHDALSLAMESGDVNLFESFTNRGARLTDSQPVYTALNRSQREMARLGLKHGANADEVLAYSMKRRSGMGIGLALDAGADADPVVRWAISRDDVGLFKDLVTVHKADAQRALGIAISANSAPYAELSITAGKASAAVALPGQVSAGSVQWVDFLVDAGADPTVGVSAAIEANNASMLTHLISLGARAGDAGHVRRASEMANLPILAVLIEKGGGKANDGLAIAVENDAIPVATYLLQKGATPAGVNVPASRGKLPMVKLLVEAGADPNQGTVQAIKNNRDEVAVYLLDKGARTTGLLPLAAERGRVVVCRKLVEKGAKPIEGMPKAVEYGKLDVAKLLIDAGANVSGPKLIALGVKKGHADVVKLLAANGAASKHVDADGNTFLHKASRKAGQERMIGVLVDAGIEVNARNNADNTALLDAVQLGNANVAAVSALLAAGADINAVDGSGKIVFQQAKGGKIKKVLKDAGAEKKP